MLAALVEFFVRRHFLVHIIVGVVIVLGVQSAMKSQREGFPAITLNQLIVTGMLPGASVEQVETEITIPIEEAIAEVDGVDSYHSQITDHRVVTIVELDESLDAVGVREVQSDLRQALDAITDFPAEMDDRPRIERVEPAKFPVIEVALAGPSQLLPSAAYQVERRLERLEGVSELSLVGLQDRELRVEVDPARARAHAITLSEITSTIRGQNKTATGGSFERAHDRKQVVADMRYKELDQVGHTVLRTGPDGSAVRVSDVARVELGREDLGLLVHTDQRPGVSVVVRKKSTADILDTVDEVVAAMAELRLPEGVEYVLVNDASFLTRNRLQLMLNNGLVGLGIVVVVLFIFLTPRAAIWVSLGVPVVLLGVVVLLPTLGLTLNMITLAGFVIVLGMLVDDAVVVAERIVVMQHRPGDQHPATAGVLSVARPVVASAITTILAFTPMLSLGGMPGKFAWALPVVVLVALVVSLFESFLILPAHMARSQDADLGHRRSLTAEDRQDRRWFMHRLELAYRSVLGMALKLRYLVLALFFGFFAFTMGVVRPLMGMELFPQDDSDALFIKVDMPVGTSLGQTEAAVSAIEAQVPSLLGEDMLAMTARIGHRDALAVDREVGSASHEAVISAMLQPLGRVNSSAQWAEILDEQLVRPAGASIVFESKRQGPPVGRPVTVHVASADDPLRRHTAHQVAGYLQSIAGVVNIETDERPGARQIELAPDLLRLHRVGLDPATLARFLQTAFHGAVATEIRGLGEDVDVRIMLEPSARADLDAIMDMPIRTRSHKMVQLRDVVQPVEVAAVAQQYHRQGVRTATVTASFTPGSGHTAESMAKTLEAALVAPLSNSRVEVYLGGEAIESRKTTRDMAGAGLIAVMGILVVIAIILNSFVEAVFVVMVIPFGITGVIWAFFLHGLPLSMFAVMGTIGLSGVVVNGAIVMVDAARQRMQAAGPDPKAKRDALIEAVVERLRPILVTTSTTVGGVMPTAYGLGGYDAFLSPMSLALGWGLLFATTITLFLVPALYTIAQDLRGVFGRRGV